MIIVIIIIITLIYSNADSFIASSSLIYLFCFSSFMMTEVLAAARC